MAAYEYDEAGVMAAYFLITFLALVLTPLTFSTIFSRAEKKIADGCQCTQCVEHRNSVYSHPTGSFLKIYRSYFLIAGWTLFAFVSYRVSLLKVEHNIYNPFEILGIKSSTPDKEIKSHFKNLSRMYHPDKVKATVNLTVEAIQDRFVKLTKAYKALTDEKIKENWVKYNNPDGPQTTSMGIALPKWIIEGKNTIWVLGAYGLVFGAALPALVGRWWFGNRQKTKDGIHAESAAAIFKTIRNEASVDEVVGALGKAYKWEMAPVKPNAKLDKLEKAIKAQLGVRWTEVRKLILDYDGELHESRKRALVLLYAHLLRLDVHDAGLRKQQKRILLQTPLLLNALLNVCIARSWLLPTLAAMRLYSCIAQALPPNASDRLRLTQLPGIDSKNVATLPPKANMSDLLHSLEEKKDPRTDDVRKALEKWGRVEIVEATFRVIGETIITPSAFVYLLVKLRMAPPVAQPAHTKELNVDETKQLVQRNHEIDEKFLESRLEAEEIPAGRASESAHAPHWPAIRKPGWWIVIADEKINRVMVQPMKIADVPLFDSSTDRNYRAFKIQFQAPPNPAKHTWRIHIISDTFVGEEVVADMTLKVEKPPVKEESPIEDEISEPEEDSLAGQMAAMKGQPVKRHHDYSDDESGTDDDDGNDTSDSDSD